jgi:hypothetical protein
MSKSNSPFLLQTTGSIAGILLVSSLTLSFWGRSGGPAWAQWLGPTFLGCLLLIPGVLFLFDPQLSLSWFRAMTPRRRDGYTSEPLLWQRLQTGERILVASGIFAVSAVGVLILFNTIPSLLRIWGIF